MWLVTNFLALFLINQSSVLGISLDQTIQTALENNDKIKQYAEKLEQAKYADREALGNFLPTVTLQAGYNHMNDPLSIDLSPIRDAMIQMQASNQVEYSNIYGLMQGNPALTAEQRASLYNQYSAGLNALLPEFRKTLKDQNYGSATLVAVQPIFMGGKLLAAKKFAAAEKQAADFELTNIKNENT
jgi:outer membrane protein